ncbi:MAG TPA: TonB-dependent receptor [Bacteroidia bacterium]
MKSKKKLLVSLYISIISFSSPLLAQNTGMLKGVVTDASDKSTIVGANIYDASDKSRVTASDVNGNYFLKMPPGKYRFVCFFVGMKSDTFNVVIEADKTSEHNIVMEPVATQLQTMVVSAGKYERKLEEITVSMEVVKPVLIENKNSTNIKGVLEQVPGLNILDGEPQIRGGSGFDFGVGSRVAILIDGLPALSGDGSALPWNFIPLENVEQIEVIKGASSVTYGSSALSGSVNVRTAYAKDEPVTKVAISSGLYDKPPVDSAKWWKGVANFSNVSVLHAHKFGQLDLVVSAMAIYDHGFIGPPFRPTLRHNSWSTDTTINDNQVGEKTGRFNFNLRYRPKKIPQLNYGVNGNFMRSSNNISLIWDNDSTGVYHSGIYSSGLYRAYPFTMTLQEQTMFYLDPFINYFSDNGLTQSIRSRYSYTKNVATSSTSTTDLSTETSMAYAEYQISKKLKHELNITGGLISDQVFCHSGLTFKGVVPDNHLENYAAYTQLDKKFWEALNFSIGMREELFKMNDEKVIAKPIFRTGLNWKAAKATFIRCSYGQGYRFPSIKEKYIHSDIGGEAIFPNPQLLAESSWNAEVGIKQGFKINNFMGYIDAAAFWQEFANTIEITFGTWDRVMDASGNYNDVRGFKYLNTGRTRVKGFEISLPGEGKIFRDLKIDVLADYTFVLPQALQPNYIFATDSNQFKMSYITTSSDTTKYLLKYRFQHIAKVDLQLTYKKFFVGGDWRYYSFMQNIDEIFYILEPQAHYGIQQYRKENNKAINIFDARIGMEITKKIKLAFVVNNVFNKRYTLRPLKIEAQRTFALRLSANF